QASYRGFAQPALHAHLVFALELGARMHQRVGELARIGEEQQPGGVEVQPPDIHPAAGTDRRELCENRGTTLRVAARDQLADRLVIRDDAGCGLARRHLDRLAVQLDGVARRDTVAELRDQAVDLDPTGFDPALDFTPRSETRGGENFL